MTLTLNCTCLAPLMQTQFCLEDLLCKYLTFYATIFLLSIPPSRWCSEWLLFEGLQRSGMSKVHTIWMKRVGLWNRERPAGELLVLSDQSYAHELCVMRQTGRNCPFAPSKCLKSQQRNFGLFSPLYCQVLCRQSIFSFFYFIFFFFPYWHNTFVQTSFKNINKL